MFSKFHHLLLFPSLSVQPHWWLDLVFYALPIVSYDTLLNKNGSHGMVSSESIDMPSPPSFHSSCIVGTAHGSDGLLPVLLGQCFPFFPRGLLSCNSFCLVLDIGNKALPCSAGLYCRWGLLWLLFHTFLDSGSSVFNSLTSVRLTFGGFSGILSSTEAPLPLWVVPWATSCVGAQFVSWPWWEPGLCILSVSLLTAASNFSKSSSSFTWVFCRQGFISILML